MKIKNGGFNTRDLGPRADPFMDIPEEFQKICRCGQIIDSRDPDNRIYDDQGIYAGAWCSERCAEKHLNLHMTTRDYAEAGERLDDEY